MKKILSLIFVIGISFLAQAQGGDVNVGANVGLTTGSGNTSFVIGGDIEYLFDVESRFDVGAASGLIFVTDANAIILPLAVAGRFQATNLINLGLDMGYGIGLNKSGNGFYFRPIFSYALKKGIRLRASYTGIESSGYFNVGAMFDL